MPRLRCLREGLLPLLSTCTRRGGGVRLGGQVLSVSALVAERQACSTPQRQAACAVKAQGTRAFLYLSPSPDCVLGLCSPTPVLTVMFTLQINPTR